MTTPVSVCVRPLLAVNPGEISHQNDPCFATSGRHRPVAVPSLIANDEGRAGMLGEETPGRGTA